MPYTFVLVHGAWHGGWCWRRVADILRAKDHMVFTPTLTGLGERTHLMRPDIGLSTHITDVVNVFAWEELDDVVLCGHSYGGMVIAGGAETIAAKIRSIVFLDAFLPRNGEALVDIVSVSPPAQEGIRSAVARGDAALPPRTAESFSVNAADRAWVDRLCRPQPIATFTDKLKLTGAFDRIPRKTYVRAKGYASPYFDRAYDTTRKDASWKTYEAPCGHDVMVDKPEWLANLLLDVA
jgi:pimeloyl-ACP methyl ester carboxylesterase